MLKKLLSLFLLLPCLLHAADFVEGQDYKVIANSTQVASKEPVVMEFFSYGCPWCYKLEAPITTWVKQLGPRVTFERIPVVFKPDWNFYAKAYYTAQTLARSEQLDPLLFKAIQDDKQALASNQSMIDFFVAHGVDKDIAQSAFESSPTIEMNVTKGMALVAQYQIQAIPAFVVNHKYKTDLQLAKTPERLVQILDFLVRKPL